MQATLKSSAGEDRGKADRTGLGWRGHLVKGYLSGGHRVLNVRSL